MRNFTYVPPFGAGFRPDARVGLRYPLAIGCTIASSRFGRRPAMLKDLSLFGCRIETPFSFLPDATLVVTIDMLSPKGGTVRWCSCSEVGLTLAAPLHPSVLERLLMLSREATPARC